MSIPKGFRHSIKTKKHLSLIKKGIPLSYKHKKNISKATKGRNHWDYREIGTIVKRSGLLYIKLGYKRWEKYYRYVVERYIGYVLKRDWTIHHIDGNNDNDKLKNLFIFKNKICHNAFETLLRFKSIDRFSIKSNLKLFRRKTNAR